MQKYPTDWKLRKVAHTQSKQEAAIQLYMMQGGSKGLVCILFYSVFSCGFPCEFPYYRYKIYKEWGEMRFNNHPLPPPEHFNNKAKINRGITNPSWALVDTKRNKKMRHKAKARITCFGSKVSILTHPHNSCR